MSKIKELVMTIDPINDELSNIITEIELISDSLDICKEDVKWFTENSDISWCFDEFGYNSDAIVKVVDAYWYDLTDLLNKMVEKIEEVRMFDYLDNIDKIQDDLDIWSMPNIENIRQLLD